MNDDKETKRYRSVYKYLRIGAREYAVLDAESAAERADDHLQCALRMLSGVVNSYIQEEINKELVLATDFGSKDAPYILSLRILDPIISTPYQQEEVAVFLKLAAERGHAEAAYRIGCSYCGLNKFPDINEAGKNYFITFESLDRSRLAEYYLMKAVEKGHQAAAEDLIMAYAYGRGFIQKNKDAFIQLCENLVAKNNQAVTVGYGAWLMGLTVQGKDPLPEAISIQLNLSKAFDNLLNASQGKNLQLAQHALYLVCEGIKRGCWGRNLEKLRKALLKSAYQGHQLLSLYLAWYSLPIAERREMPKILDDYQLVELSRIVDVNEDNALTLLNSAFFGQDEDIAQVAKEILIHVFGRYFMNDDGMLVWDRKQKRVMEEDLVFYEVDAV